MHRTACVDVYGLPLQLLLRRHPDWSGQPAAVVSEDKPLGTVLAVNGRARATGVRTGMRYAAALSLTSELQAGVVAEHEIAAGIETILLLLQQLSPQVEAAGHAAAEPGVFWLEVAGIRRHYPSPQTLARVIRRRLWDARFTATVAIGFSRFGAYVLARQAPEGGDTPGERRHARERVSADAAGERAAALQAPLELLPLAPPIRDILERLDVCTVEALLALPYAELLKRFGAEVAAVHRFASDDLDVPVQGEAPAEGLIRRRRLSYRENDSERLLGLLEVLLDSLLDQLRERGAAVLELELELLLENGSSLRERMRPATPTAERRPLLELLALRLRSLDLSDSVEELALDAHQVPLRAAQIELFRRNQRRDLQSGAEAFARIRAEYGNASVLRAVVHQAHLPETQYSWQPLDAPELPRPARVIGPGEAPPSAMVRRLLRHPQPTPPPSRLIGVRRYGPFLLSSGWWLERQTDRAYYFAPADDHMLQWLYYDRVQERWFLHGWIE